MRCKNFQCQTELLAGILAVALIVPRPLSAAILAVTNLGDSGEPGQLRTLIDAAAPGDTIVIPAGIIELTERAGGGLRIAADLTLQGAGAGVTYIDASAAPGDTVVEIAGATVHISGMTILQGGTGLGPGSRGSGITNSGTLVLTDVTLRGSIECCGGGGIVNGPGAFASLTGATVSGNRGFETGGIQNSGIMTLTNVSVSGNDGGGGIRNDGTLTVTSSTISGNFGETGGGLFNTGTATVTNSTISGNQSRDGGGIGNQGTLTVINSTLSGNLGGIDGGGLFNAGSATIINSTLSGNSSPDGGGIKNRGTLAVTSSTISGNLAFDVEDPTADGIVNAAGGAATLRNTIVANSAFRNCLGTFTSLGHTLDTGTTCGFTGFGDIGNASPLLGPLQNNGGPTQTQAPLAGSPAIDAGDIAGCPATDQRGIARPQGSACDIGAYEVATFDAPAAAAFVTRLYQQVLGRAPEPGGVGSWVQQIEQIGAVSPIILGFFHAPEFLSRHSSNEQYLSILYRALLNREPDPSALDAFVSQLQAGRLTRDDILDIFLDSPEFARQTGFLPPLDPVTAFVTTLYVAVLRRGPDEIPLRNFVTDLQQSRSSFGVIAFFLNSPEFLQRNTTNTEFVTLLYRVFLNRRPDPEGLATWVAALTQGITDRGRLDLPFILSPEFQAIERARFPFPNIAAVYRVTGTVSFTRGEGPGNITTVPLAGIMEWTQAGARIVSTFSSIPLGQVQFPVAFDGTMTPFGDFSGFFRAISSREISFLSQFHGSVSDNAFSLQFSAEIFLGLSGQFMSGSLAGVR